MENEQKADMRQMMFSVPLYFRATQGATNTAAGSHLFPAVLGNTAGGLIAGFTIQKRIAFFVPPFSSSRIPTDSTVSPALQFLPSSQSSTNTAPRAGRYKHLTILAALSSALIYLQPQHSARSPCGMYMSTSIGMTISIAISASIQLNTLRSFLISNLSPYKHSAKVRVPLLFLAVKSRIKCMELPLTSPDYRTGSVGRRCNRNVGGRYEERGC